MAFNVPQGQPQQQQAMPTYAGMKPPAQAGAQQAPGNQAAGASPSSQPHPQEDSTALIQFVENRVRQASPEEQQFVAKSLLQFPQLPQFIGIITSPTLGQYFTQVQAAVQQAAQQQNSQQTDAQQGAPGMSQSPAAPAAGNPQMATSAPPQGM